MPTPKPCPTHPHLPAYPGHSYCKLCNPYRQTRRRIKAQRNQTRPKFSFIDYWIKT